MTDDRTADRTADVWKSNPDPGRGQVSPRPVAGVGPRGRRSDVLGSTGLLGCAVFGVVIVATSAAAIFVNGRPDTSGGVPASAAAVAAADAAPAIVPAVVVPGVLSDKAPAVPLGAGAIASQIAGNPAVSVYFATAKAEVSPDFARAAAPVKLWADGHPGTRVTVSGFNDPRGDAAANAALAKTRAQNVAAALTALGVPAGAITLVKPAQPTDTGVSNAQARRVDVAITNAP